MALRLAPHLYARVAASFAGFFSGGLVFSQLFFGDALTPILLPFLFFGLIFGGAYLAQLAFSFAFPAVCPACRAASAVPTLRQPTVYVCRACAVATDAMQALLVGQLESMRLGSVEKGESFLAWVFVIVGLACMGGSLWGMQDSVALLQHGTATAGKVLRVTQKSLRNSKGKPETTFSAVIEYHVGNVPHTLTRSWAIPNGGSCAWPCYIEGQPVEVIYEPGEPSRAKLLAPAELFGVTGMFIFGGLIFATIGGLILRHRHRNPPRPPPESWKEMRDLIASLKQQPPPRKEPVPGAGRAGTTTAQAAAPAPGATPARTPPGRSGET